MLTVTFTKLETEVPHELVAVTLTVAVPEKVELQVTVPVVPVPDIVFPVPETLQV